MINPPVRPLTFTELFHGTELAEKGMLVASKPSSSGKTQDSPLPFLLLTGIAVVVTAIVIYQYETAEKRKENASSNS